MQFLFLNQLPESEKSKEQLLKEINILKDRLMKFNEIEKVAQDRLKELEKFYKATIDRELRMVELKKTIKNLELRLNG